MLVEIKSSFITKVVLSFLKDIKKLKLIKYNKYFQKRINIDILHYKFFSGKYIIYISKNKGKEYDAYDDYLIYEGEYLKGERNGKGKEYDKDKKLIYEGEFLKGKRHGKGEEYSNGVNLLFRGKYLNGKRNGEGEKYYNNGKIEFKGEYLNGKKWNGKFYSYNGFYINMIKNGKGNIKEYDEVSSKLIFEGEYLNGERNGKGKEYLAGKLIFEGEYLNGKRWKGKGYNIKDKSYIYELKDGKGFLKDYYKQNGNLQFEGEYLNGEKNGKCKEFYNNGKFKIKWRKTECIIF